MRGAERRAAAVGRRVNAALIYLLLLKATMTSFAGMGSLPQIQEDFVAHRGAITEQQLSQAVLLGRATVGPIGAYVVAVGYFAGGWPGAVAGWLAMSTPALIAVPLLAFIQRWLHLPRIRAAVDGVVIASAVLLIGSGVTLAVDAIRQLSRLVA
jgi:chromate transporter